MNGICYILPITYFLFVIMKTCILYFSQTGNTKMFAEAISEALKVGALYDISVINPSVIADYDILILGTPIHGFNPSK